jgi:RND family efflux transporter MFP subunit
MPKLRYAVLALVLATISFTGGAWWTRHDTAPAEGQKATVYACPMHPHIRSDHPGDCPSCGMRLEPVREAGSPPPAGGNALPAGAVQVSVERQQAVGVRLGVAERLSGARTLRTTGRVAPNENATYPITAGTSGWIRSVGAATTGSSVKKNEVLASFYAPDFVNAQQSYFASLETLDRAGNKQIPTYSQTRVIDGLERFADSLRNLGVSEIQLAEMAKKRQLVQDIYLTSPVTGFVLQRNVAAGLRFDRGFEFYRIADLDRIWILADVYQHQLPFIKPGMTARATTAQVPEPFSATVSRSEPIFDEATLTLKVRLEASNPRHLLKPGMFMDVEFTIDVPETLAVPADAIVDSGLRKTVFVDRGNGYFEPRQVDTGWRIGDQVEVTRGLMPGERIVISGTFLIDSESRMKAAAQGIFGAAAEDPVCGMQVDEKRALAAGRTLEHDGHTYYFCADDCKRSFQQNPARYLKSLPPPASERAPAHAPGQPAMPPENPKKASANAEVAKDPICNMDVNVKDAVAAGLVSRRDGRTFYFCAEQCKQQFDAAATKP